MYSTQRTKRVSWYDSSMENMWSIARVEIVNSFEVESARKFQFSSLSCSSHHRNSFGKRKNEMMYKFLLGREMEGEKKFHRAWFIAKGIMLGPAENNRYFSCGRSEMIELRVLFDLSLLPLSFTFQLQCARYVARHSKHSGHCRRVRCDFERREEANTRDPKKIKIK